MRRFLLPFLGAALLPLALACCDDDSESAGAAAGAGGAGTAGAAGGFDCSSLQAMGAGPGAQPGAGGSGDNPLACMQTKCSSECAELITTFNSFGGPGGPGGAAGSGSGPASPGEKLYQERSCASCHGTRGEGSAGPNITPSQTAGIGDWTEAEIRTAIREGKGKGDQSLCSSMPRWEASQIDDAALGELVAFLQSLPAIDLPNEGSLCATGTSGAGGMPPMTGLPSLTVPPACLSCLDVHCPEIAGPLRCFAGAP